MSTVIAIISHTEICMASDTMVTDHETGQICEPAIKQITLNENISIGFVGSGNIAQVIMNTLTDPRNEIIVSKLTFSEIPNVLDDIYQDHIITKQYPDKETRHVSALIIGFNGHTPEIIRWDSTGIIKVVKHDYSNSFTASILPPHDVPIDVCKEVLLELGKMNLPHGVSGMAMNYFKVISSISQYTSQTATIWVHPTFGIIGAF